MSSINVHIILIKALSKIQVPCPSLYGFIYTCISDWEPVALNVLKLALATTYKLSYIQYQ